MNDESGGDLFPAEKTREVQEAVACILTKADRVAGEPVPPFQYEKINLGTDGVNFKIIDGRYNQIHTCYEKSLADAIVLEMNERFSTR